LDLQVFGSGPSATTKGDSRVLSMRNLEIAVADLDRNGRPNVLITTLQAGASGQTYTLHVIGIGDDMSFVRHTLSSGTPIEVMDHESLRPVFPRRFYDGFRPGEPYAAIGSRGYRNAYYQWTIGDGFVRF